MNIISNSFRLILQSEVFQEILHIQTRKQIQDQILSLLLLEDYHDTIESETDNISLVTVYFFLCGFN